MDIFLPFVVVLPLGIGFILALLPRKYCKVSDILVIFVSAVILFCSCLLFGYEGVYEIGGWISPVGISLNIDAFSWLILVVVSIISFCVLFFSVKYMQIYTSRIRYYVIFMMMIAGINGTILAGDIFNRFVYIELAAISSYILVGFGCGSKELFAALKYAVLGAIASSVTILGIALLYGLYGTVNISHLAASIQQQGFVFMSFNALFLAALLMIIGFSFKSALIPFHIWQPDALSSAPVTISAIISGALVGSIGVYAMLRTVFSVFGITVQLGWILAFLGMVSMVGGIFFTFSAKAYKRILSYYSISQIGYVLFGFGFGGQLIARSVSPIAAALAITGGMYHLINHSIFKTLLFLDYGFHEYNMWQKESKDSSNGKISVGSIIGLLSMAGIPPLSGFISKAMIISACFIAGYYIVGSIAFITAIVTIFSFYKTKKYFWFSLKKDRGTSTGLAFMKIPVIFLALLCFVFSLLILPPLKTHILEPAYNSIIGYNLEIKENNNI